MASALYPYSWSSRYPNVSFYENKMSAAPNNECIEDILDLWSDNFFLLEQCLDYIQWLFPIREAGLNKLAFPLLPEEAKKIRETPVLRERAKRAFKMMLNFYGMKLTWNDKFELNKNSEERLRVLNQEHNHNFQRITRILKSLMEFGYYKLMKCWLEFLADLIFKERKLDYAEFSFQHFWVHTLDAQDKSSLESYVKTLVKSKPNSKTAHTTTTTTTTTTSDTTAKISNINKSGTDMVNHGIGNVPPTPYPYSWSSRYPNVSFYENKMSAAPKNECIEDILDLWSDNFFLLEQCLDYIQWLFPIREAGLNKLAFPLLPEEAKKIRETPVLRERAKRAFKMMLNFYGMKLTWNDKFVLNKNSEERLRVLNQEDNHNFQRITRILISLMEFGYYKLMKCWLEFLADLIFKERKLDYAEFSFQNFWIHTLDAQDKSSLESYVKTLVKSKPNSKTAHTTTTTTTTTDTTAKISNINKSGTDMVNHGIGNVPPKSPGNLKILAFYKNQIPLEQSGEFIKDVLNWKGDYDKLRKDPYYIHWLFPTTEYGNKKSRIVLTDAEAKEIQDTPELKKKVLKAFEMMLDLYGMNLTHNQFRIIDQERLKILNKEDNPHLKHITRILSTLQHLGYNDLMQPWMKFLAELIYREKSLSCAMFSFQYWLDTLDRKDRANILDHVRYIA